MKPGRPPAGSRSARSVLAGPLAPASATRLAVLALALLACRPGAVDPPGLPPLPAPFERAPYLQAVDTSSALVLWKVRPSTDDRLRYRSAGAEWREAPVTREPDGRRRAALEGLRAGEEAEYEVTAAGVRLGPFSFRAAPHAPQAERIRVLAFGDSGFGSEPQLLLARWMEEMPWDLIVHMGDIAYEDGTESEFTRRHFLVYRRLLARVPFFPVPGNHDLRADGGQSYDRAFAWPASIPGARWYAFRWGPVQFVALDTSSDAEDVRGLEEGSGRQFEWLGRTLAAARGDPGVGWTVVYAHEPVYSHAAGFSGHGPGDPLRRVLAPLFDAHGVDLVLAGHEHHYERTHPVRDGRPVPEGCGPVYVLTGGGGATRYARDVGTSPIAARTSRAHHFVALEVTGGAIVGTAVGTDGSAIDEFEVRPYDPAAPGCE